MVLDLDAHEPEDIDILHWFVFKGASLATLQRSQPWPACHFVAAKLTGRVILTNLDPGYGKLSGMNLDFDKSLKSLSRILRDGILENVTLMRDSCICACSFSGCTMHSMLLKELRTSRSPRSKSRHEFKSIRILPYIDWWISVTTANHVPRKEDVMEVLRVFLFDELGLTHTCCEYLWFNGYSSFVPFEDPEDIREIHEEERETIERLEGLLQIASEQWDNHTGSFLDFLKTFLQQIDLSKADDPPEDYIQRLKELGAQVEVDDPPNDYTRRLKELGLQVEEVQED
ncbi:hypothetical protein MMC20_002834 [Loxospora ochrophaea]|nr:hypothetical protein [Loxospora ochrophaea]